MRVGGMFCVSVYVVFFFQAEDGIRDKLVTGVQTCALPILQELAKNGVDMVEIGMPFSDPLADGPTIQNSSEKIGRASCRERV